MVLIVKVFLKNRRMDSWGTVCDCVWMQEREEDQVTQILTTYCKFTDNTKQGKIVQFKVKRKIFPFYKKTFKQIKKIMEEKIVRRNRNKE